MLPPFAHLRPVLVDAQTAFQLLGAALLLRRRVPFALLLAQGFKFLLQGIVTRPGRLVRVSHGGSSLSFPGGAILPSDRTRGGLAKAGGHCGREALGARAGAVSQRRSGCRRDGC